MLSLSFVVFVIYCHRSTNLHYFFPLFFFFYINILGKSILSQSFEGTSPVYVPSSRAMLPVQYMATPSQGSMATPPTSSSLWPATPAGDVSAYASQATHLHASTGAFSYNTGGGAGAGTSPGGGRGDSGYGTPLGRHAATGLGGYPVTAAAAAAAYMGADLSPWNTFNNMALQQGFRPTTGPGE